jgi:mono/diheme cytochrome c family protein
MERMHRAGIVVVVVAGAALALGVGVWTRTTREAATAQRSAPEPVSEPVPAAARSAPEPAQGPQRLPSRNVEPRGSLPLVASERIGDGETGSRVVLARTGGRLRAYVADDDDRAIHVVDVATGAHVGAFELGSRPAQMVMTRAGRLWVALRDEARVVALDATSRPGAPLAETAELATATEPVALATTPDDATLLVASGRASRLEGLRLATGERVLSVETQREPRAVLVAAGGARAYVGHAAASALTVVDLETSRARSIDLHRAQSFWAVLPCAPPPPDAPKPERDPYQGVLPERFARQGYALVRIPGDPHGKAWDFRSRELVLAPTVMVAPGPIAGTTRGYGEDPRTSLMTARLVDTKDDGVLDDPGAPLEHQGDAPGECLLPRAAVKHPDKPLVYVACLGRDEVRENDLRYGTYDPFPSRRFSVPAGPVGLAVDPATRTLVVWSQMARVLTVIALDERRSAKGSPVAGRSVELPWVGEAPPLDAEVARGRALFHSTGDTRIARDGRACASCHPEGRDDGLVWSSPEGPRQTPSLAGRIAAGPFGWRGEHATLAAHVTSTIDSRLRGKGLPDDDVAALAAYVRSLPPPPALPASAGDDDRVARGRALFTAPETGCAHCHENGGSDGLAHDVESRGRADRFADFRTPSLVGAGGSAPYFHDGRYATLGALLAHTDGRMGNTTQLSPEDRDALAAYLATL